MSECCSFCAVRICVLLTNICTHCIHNSTISIRPTCLAITSPSSRSTTDEFSRKLRTKGRWSNTTVFNNWHTELLRVSIPRESPPGSSYWTFETHQFLLFSPLRTDVQNVLCELLDGDFLGLETYSNVQCQLLKWVTCDVFIHILRGHCNTTGWLSVSLL